MSNKQDEELVKLMQEVEIVFPEDEQGKFKFTIDSLRHSLTGEKILEGVRTDEITLNEFYKFLLSKQKPQVDSTKPEVRVDCDFITENWKQVVPFIINGLDEKEMHCLLDIVKEDPIITALTEITKVRKGKNPLVISAKGVICNADACFMLANVYEYLTTLYGLNLICVEGAVGEIDTSWFRAFPDEKIRKEVATYFVKKGEITASEFASIVGKKFPIIFGIDNKEDYITLLSYETHASKEGAPIPTYTEAKRAVEHRGQLFLNTILPDLISTHKPSIMVVERTSVGMYRLPDLFENTDYSLIEISPRSKGDINWELYRKVIRNERDSLESLIKKD